MLITNFQEIGIRLRAARKLAGLTQAELAERAGLADRTYADIERGETNMRIETLLRICAVLKITPDQVLTREEEHGEPDLETVMQSLRDCAPHDRSTALALLTVYLQSLE